MIAITHLIDDWMMMMMVMMMMMILINKIRTILWHPGPLELRNLSALRTLKEFGGLHRSLLPLFQPSC
jgi:hypothetical protein